MQLQSFAMTRVHNLNGQHFCEPTLYFVLWPAHSATTLHARATGSGIMTVRLPSFFYQLSGAVRLFVDRKSSALTKHPLESPVEGRSHCHWFKSRG